MCTCQVIIGKRGFPVKGHQQVKEARWNNKCVLISAIKNRNQILSFNEIWPDLTWDSHTADVLCFQTCPPKAGNKKLTVTYVFIFVYKCQVSVHIPLPLFENFQSILPKSFCVNLVPTLSLHDDTYHVLQSISPWNQNHQILFNCSWKQLHMIY